MNLGPKFEHLTDGTCWPVDGLEHSVQWKLRYGGNLTKEERLFAASVMQAYAEMATAGTKKERQAMVERVHRAHFGGAA